MASKTIIALTARDLTLEWTTLQLKQKERYEVGVQESRQLNPPEEGAWDWASDEAVAQLRAIGKGLKGVICLGIPTERALLRVVDLPTDDPEEITDMVDLQVDKFSPFPVDQMLISWEWLDRQETRSRVLIAAVQSDYLETYGGAFHRARLTPNQMDVDVMGWWHLLREGGHVAEQGRQVVLLLDQHSIELVVTENGIPLIFRSLGGHMSSDAEATAAEVAEEVSYTLTTLEADWGSGGPVRLSLWHEGEVPGALPGRLEAECGTTCEVHHLGQLPPLSEGLVRRSVERGEGVLDLSPQEWHDAERARAVRKKLTRASVALLGVWLLVVMGFILALQLQKASIKRLKRSVLRVEEPAELVRKQVTKVQELEAYADRTYSGLECLREISSALPAGVDLTSFIYKKAKEVSLKGTTSPAGVNDVYKLFEDLESSPLFERISNQKVTTRTSGRSRKAQFTVVAHLPHAEEEEQP